MSAYTVTCRWDEEGGVWYVAASDVPGLATEAETLDELVRKLEDLIPELLELSDQLPPTPDIDFVVHAERRARTSLAA